ncbi:MAG: glycosyltransferase family 4 protein [Bacteroidales bacterium]|nr:glycosyltransferase family 4 protein [Bacteroidales bacterium]MCM1146584.1 glycosyltransferase family 4 protein [Bacteroidales bacterium]MCM1205976.1 glycosyltransferase family 4 protein [Bacillota bacterium]MCM1510143.1 glycosyltransferase family 4 protein [Clostridium sp.]
MKIAYISLSVFADCDIPLVNALAEKGVDITYYMIMSDKNRQGTVIDIRAMKTEAKVFPAGDYPELKAIESLTDLRRMRIVNMPVAHNYAWQSFVLAHRFKKELKAGGFDIIHFTWPFDYCFFCLYSLDIPMLFTVHDPIPHSSDEKFIYNLQRGAAIKRADYFMLLNETQTEEFKQRYSITDNRIFHSRLSIYTHLSHHKPGAPIHDATYILFMGSINPHKGIKYLCEAMEEARKTCPELQLVIAGKGTFDFNIADYTCRGYVKLINRFIETDELINLVRHSQFVCCPYTDATQSGVVMSAFALCKPVLATNVGALHEMIDNGRHGMLVAPKDSHALAEAIAKMNDRDVLEEMKNNIICDYRNGEKSWSTIADNLIDNYNILIKNRRA